MLLQAPIGGKIVESEGGQDGIARCRKQASGGRRRRRLQPVAYSRNGFDFESLRICKVRQIADLGGAAADGVFAHEAAAPASTDRFVAGNDRALAPAIVAKTCMTRG
ncbi:MAG TPA: hypothetical protein VHX61_00470 [Rhizomicrobium sp.]|jgi:hypothetical protein|nr:hypothetical protein [Rhizomicrobium sp.]